MVKWIILGLVIVAMVGLAVVTIHVQREAPYRSELLVRGEAGRALILYHPSRDAQFSDELTLALARGFEDAKLSVERRTMASATPPDAQGFDVIAVVSNTFYGRPDWPTMRYLKRASFQGTSTIGIMAGSGATGRAQVVLTKALGRTGADLRGGHSLWISRPNDPARPNEDNRQVASSMARKYAFELGQLAQAGRQADERVSMKMTVPVATATAAHAQRAAR